MMTSCGYGALQKYCSIIGCHLTDSAWLALEDRAELSFYDFAQVIESHGYTCQAYYSEEKIPLPCIAYLQRGKFQHYVVLLRYDWLVWYYEPWKGKRVLPRLLFQQFFTKKVFVVDCF